MGFQDFQDKISNRTDLNFRTRSSTITINQEESLITIYWEACSDPEEFRCGYQLAADLVKRFYIRNWLNDARHVAYLNIENQNWILRHIVPQLYQNNMRKLARVVLDEPLAILVSSNILDKITTSPELGRKLNCEMFTDFHNALSWLHY